MKKRFSNSRLSQKTLIIAVVALIVVFGFFFTYDKLVSPTRIALVNFQPYMATSIQLANTDKFIKYENMSLDELRKLNSADFVLAFGMGLKMSAEQREQLQKAIDKGVDVNVVSATTPDNMISTLDSIQKENVSSYIKMAEKRTTKVLLAIFVLKLIRKSCLSHSRIRLWRHRTMCFII